MTSLRLFPARAAIGVAVDKDGRSFNVFSTTEFNRALTALLARVGGEEAASNTDIETLLSFVSPPNAEADKAIQDLRVESMADHSAEIAELRKTVEELKTQLSYLTDQSAAVAEVKKYAQDLEISYSFVAPLTDWEHPGSIGAKTANAGAFTTLTASGAVALSPADASVTASPTGTGTVTLSPATAGTINNMSIGATTASTVRGTTIESTVSTGTPPFIVASTTQVNNLRAATASALAVARSIGGVNFNGTANITVQTATGAAGFTVTNGFGCNGATAQTAYAVGAAATDAATTQTLANNIRDALIANGIATA